MSSRREARRAAIDVLYQSDVTGEDPIEVLDAWSAADREVPAFGRELVEGTADHLPDIDLLLEEHAEDWPVSRMAAVDRTILRVGIEELVFRDDVPDAVAINEAVEAANALSTEDSGRFVNGILGRIVRELRARPSEPPAPASSD
ncbi:MAG TPA: transcription antitermination factor NusB [Actinomycetota bacterium]|nr:transcription antitermination factor NusB [Actinomycetota bacterium]